MDAQSIVFERRTHECVAAGEVSVTCPGFAERYERHKLNRQKDAPCAAFRAYGASFLRSAAGDK